MSEYKVTQINVDGPPNEWAGPKGKVYYIGVMLDGWDKPVSIGKKTPDALKIGDTVYGEVIETDYLTDKWKHSEAPQHGSSSPSAGSDTQYLKDTSDLPRSLIIELLKYYDVQSLYNSPQYTKMISLAQSLNDDIMLMIKANRLDGGSQVTEVSIPSPQPIKSRPNVAGATSSLGDKFRARNPGDGLTAGEPEIEDTNDYS